MDATPLSWALWLCRGVETGAAVLLAGTAVLRLLARGAGIDPATPGWRRPARGSAWWLLAAGAGQFVLTAAQMSGRGPGEVLLASGVLRTVLGSTRFGAVWSVRAALLAAWLGGEFVETRGRASRRRVPGVLTAGEPLLAFAVLASLVFAGHAQASPRSAWLLPADVVHALAAGVWPGGLLPLARLLRAADRDPSLLPAAETVARRFSRWSVVAVGVLAGSGLLNGIGLVGTPAALWTSAYGRWVLCKVTLFAVMVGLGAVNRRLVLRRAPVTPARALHRLRRNVAIECVLAAGVVLATEALGTTAPPMPHP